VVALLYRIGSIFGDVTFVINLVDMDIKEVKSVMLNYSSCGRYAFCARHAKFVKDLLDIVNSLLHIGNGFDSIANPRDLSGEFLLCCKRIHQHIALD